jgi:hypothetical protein
VSVEIREHEEHAVQAPPPRGGRRYLTGAGWVRVAWLMPLSFGLATLFVIGARAALGYDPLWELPALIAA